MKKRYNNPQITITNYEDVIMTSKELYASDNIGNLSEWVSPNSAL